MTRSCRRSSGPSARPATTKASVRLWSGCESPDEKAAMLQSPFGQTVASESLQQRHSPFVLGSAAFAFVWVVARACVQSVTIDEADTYLYSVLPPGPSPFNPTSNNHVLNSLLMRLVTMIFGASHLTLRIPTLLGAGLFIAA